MNYDLDYRVSNVSADAETIYEATAALTVEVAVGDEVLGTVRINQPYTNIGGKWSMAGDARLRSGGMRPATLTPRLRGAALLLDPMDIPEVSRALAAARLSAAEREIAGIRRGGERTAHLLPAAEARRDEIAARLAAHG